MSVKILLFGCEGQIGSSIIKLFPRNYNILALHRLRNNAFCGDLEDFVGIKNTINMFKPDVIINAAAFTKVDLCEVENDKANKINALAVKNIAEAAKDTNSFLIHYSTDYVFNGLSSLPIKEDEVPDPINYYGKTKLKGEQEIELSKCNYAIIRTSWIYSNSGENFLLKILSLNSKKNNIRIIDDQYGVPTSANEVADFTLHVVNHYLNKKKDLFNFNNIYHFSSDGQTNWYEYAIFIAKNAIKYGVKINFKTKDIIAVKSAEYETKAVRPKNSKLDSSLVKKKFSIDIKHWRYNVEETIKSL